MGGDEGEAAGLLRVAFHCGNALDLLPGMARRESTPYPTSDVPKKEKK